MKDEVVVFGLGTGSDYFDRFCFVACIVRMTVINSSVMF